jgi:hypothetical protein
LRRNGHSPARLAAERSVSACDDRSKTELATRMLPDRTRRRMPGGQKCSERASSKDTSAFDAHSVDGRGRGLVQYVFHSPARPRATCRFGKSRAPRRQAKNALHLLPPQHGVECPFHAIPPDARLCQSWVDSRHLSGGTKILNFVTNSPKAARQVSRVNRSESSWDAKRGLGALAGR